MNFKKYLIKIYIIRNESGCYEFKISKPQITLKILTLFALFTFPFYRWKKYIEKESILFLDSIKEEEKKILSLYHIKSIVFYR